MHSQSEYWDKIADEMVCTTPLNLEWFEKYVDKDALILDVGCGYGRTLGELADDGYKNLVGVDSSSKMIERGHHEYPELNLIVSDGEKIDMPDNSVDALLLFGVLTTIPHDEDQEKLIVETQRVLKPGGYIFVNDFCLNGDTRNMDRYFYYFEEASDDAPYGTFMSSDGGVLRHHRVDYLEDLFARFQKCEERLCDWETAGGHTSRAMAFVGRKRF